jgi:selenide, water dikinase
VLRPIENLFQAADYPDLLVGMDAPDDAAVWRLDEQRALVVTTDFFTPVVDDPYDYGAIAAANSMSDVYAMGGQPFLALNVAALPPDLPPEIGAEIIRGGAEKAREAGVAVAGGHTIQDKEPKYGLIVVGFVDPQRMLTKGGARAGDVLVLTKPLGMGVTTTALKRGAAADEDVAEAVRWMKMLNRTASQLAVEFELKAGTDITGFSLLGHAFEMARGSGTAFRFSYSQIPLLSGARRYADLYTFPGGAADNRLYFQEAVRFSDEIDDPGRMLLFDPQTNGGLLLAVPSARLSDFSARAAALDQPVWVVGEVLAGDGIEVR